MGKIRCGYGSEWHLLRYLGYHRDELSRQVLTLTGGELVRWLDFGYHPTYDRFNYDRELVGLEFIDDQEVREEWKAFWPAHGNSQNWDAVGEINYGDHNEWLLVEAKAHVREIESHCGATNQKSIAKINAALGKTMVAFSDLTASLEIWQKKYYQYANRLATLYFLMKECKTAIPARLLFIYFIGDQRDDAECPQSEGEWRFVVEDMEEKLGIDQERELYQRVEHLYIPVNPENEKQGEPQNFKFWSGWCCRMKS